MSGPARPTGTVTFLFTDIEGSTAFWAEGSGAMGASLRVHDELVRAVVARMSGYVFATGGDGFGVAFARASDGVAAARALQERLAEVDWPGPALRVRMGLHLGEAEERDGDYFGPPVNLAARVMGAARGGQVLASALVVAAAQAAGQATSVGAVRLRGVPEPVALCQLGPGHFPPPRTEQVDAPVVLPRFRTSLVGRDREVDELAALVRDHAVVTVTGAGGAGKTRLAVEVAARGIDAFPDGVWFVDLSGVEEDTGVPGAVMDVLDLSPLGGLATTAQIVAYLRDRRALLVVDNCEHLLDPVAVLVDDVVTGSVGLRVLCTSREVLDVGGEVVWRIPSLPTGPDSASTTLFLERARAAGWSGPEEREVVAEIGRRLDGIPLAIELAAARARSMPIPQIRDRLDERFRLLSGGGRRARRRQQTLEATVRWSYDLLDPAEQELLGVLGVFVGGFRADDAAAVAGLDEWDALERLDSLVAKSMVQPVASAGVARYRLLETVRMFALDRLVEAGRATEVRDAHLARFVAEAGRLPFALLAPQERAAADYDNVLAAGQWAIDRGRPADAARLADMAQECLNARGALDTALLWLDCDTGLSDAERVRAQALMAHLSWYRLDADRVRHHVAAALELGGDRPFDGLPLAHLTRTYTGALERDFDLIEPSLDAAEAAARRLPDPNPSLALVAVLRAAWAEAWGDFAQTVDRARESIALAPELYSRSLVEAHLIVSLLALGRVDEARAARAAAVAPPASSPQRHLTDIAALLLEGVDDPEGAPVRGARLAAESTRRQPHTVGDWLLGFGWLALMRGDRDRALAIGYQGMSLMLPSASVVAAAEGWDPAERKANVERYWGPIADGPEKLVLTQQLFDDELRRWGTIPPP